MRAVGTHPTENVLATGDPRFHDRFPALPPRRFDEFERLIFGNFERKGFLRTPLLMN